jgi:hypothetical protein
VISCDDLDKQGARDSLAALGNRRLFHRTHQQVRNPQAAPGMRPLGQPKYLPVAPAATIEASSLSALNLTRPNKSSFKSHCLPPAQHPFPRISRATPRLVFRPHSASYLPRAPPSSTSPPPPPSRTVSFAIACSWTPPQQRIQFKHRGGYLRCWASPKFWEPHILATVTSPTHFLQRCLIQQTRARQPYPQNSALFPRLRPRQLKRLPRLQPQRP